MKPANSKNTKPKAKRSRHKKTVDTSTRHSSAKRFENKLDKLLKQADLKKYNGIYIHTSGKHWKIEEINYIADQMHKWFLVPKHLWFKDFAISLGVPHRLFKEKFCKESPYFKYIFELCQDIQESKLFSAGIVTRSSMPIFALKNVAAWRDKQDVAQVSVTYDIKDLPPEYLERIAAGENYVNVIAEYEHSIQSK